MLRRHLTNATIAALFRGGGAVLFLLILARAWGVEAFGEFVYAFTVANLLGLLVDYGFQIKCITDLSLATSKSSKIISCILLIKLALLGVLAGVVAIAVFFDESQAWIPPEIFPLFTAYSLNSILLILYSPFKVQGRYEPDARIAFFDFVAVLLLSASALYFDLNITQVSWLLFVLKALILIVALFEYLQTFSLTPVNITDVLMELRTGVVFAAHAAIGALYLNVDTFIVRAYADAFSFGIYQSGIRLVVGAGVLLTIVNAVFTPRFGKYLRTKDIVIKHELLMVSLICTIGIIALCGLLWFFGDAVAVILYGEAFRPLGELLWIFSAIIGLRVIGSFFGVVLSLVGRQALRLVIGILSLIAIVTLDLIVVPYYGILSAALVLLAVHLVILLLYAGLYNKYIPRHTIHA